MKHVSLLENWADEIIREANSIGDRPIPRTQDIQYKASVKYPDRSPQQALQLYVADEFKDKEQMDFAQNKLINAQKRENDKLRKSLQDLGNELQSHEREAEKTDREVARLKDLSSKLKPAGELSTQVAKASADKVESMLKDLESFKSKPGIDDEKYKELKSKVDQIKQNAGDKEIEKVQNALQVLNTKQNVGDEMFSKVMSQLEKTQADLESKEQRFQKSIERNRDQRNVWGVKFQELNNKIKEIETKTSAADDAAEILDAKLKELAWVLPQVKQASDTSKLTTDKKEEPKFNFVEPANQPNLPNSPMVAEDLTKFKDNPMFLNWVKKTTPTLLNMFNSRFSDFAGEYDEKQIIDQFHEYMPYLWSMEEITNQTVDDLFKIVKVNLKQEGPKPTQKDLFPNLNEAYEKMLDEIIGLPEIFKK